MNFWKKNIKNVFFQNLFFQLFFMLRFFSNPTYMSYNVFFSYWHVQLGYYADRDKLWCPILQSSHNICNRPMSTTDKYAQIATTFLKFLESLFHSMDRWQISIPRRPLRSAVSDVAYLRIATTCRGYPIEFRDMKFLESLLSRKHETV